MDFLISTNAIAEKTWGLDCIFKLFGNYAKLSAIILERLGVDATKLRTISSRLISYRTITRFVGIPSAVESLSNHIAKNDKSDIVTYNILLVQNITLIFYYLFEQISWLRSAKILSGPTGDLDRKSCQCWAIMIVFSMFLTFRKWKKAKETEDKPAVIGHQVSLLKSVCDLIMALHWSVKHSKVPEIVVSLAGSTSATISIQRQY